MALMGMRDVCWGFGGAPLLENITFHIEKGDRVCLLGRNGAGKTTLLKILSGEIFPDTGSVWRGTGIRLASLKQDVPVDFSGTIFDVAARGFGEKEWETSLQVENILSQMGLDPEERFSNLSAGMKRRALFAQALARKPDILLLDEPTNHLDIEAIAWMEDFLLKKVNTLVFVSHDRAFVKKIANRIIELDRGRIFSQNCDYDTFLKRRDEIRDAEDKENSEFDKKLSREEAWIRQGVKARRTRNEGRVGALKKMREEFKARRKKTGDVKFKLQESQRTGKLVIQAGNISWSYENNLVIDRFSTVVMRGEKIGIIGPNGVGKTTLLKLLLKEIPPDAGDVRHGTHLETAYFDQMRDRLDEDKTVYENIGEGNDFIFINGEKRHVVGYLQDFLFPPERCRTPVHILSGGEKNRLLLAKLFARPANVLVLDEPTNDLDMETLELLEDLLFQYTGTILLVSHDRAFLNNVVTGTLVFEGNGKLNEYPGGYDDWLSQRPDPEVPALVKKDKKGREKPASAKTRRPGYMEKRELEELPGRIDALEREREELHAELSNPLFYKKERTEMAGLKARLEIVEAAIENAYSRWDELDGAE